MTHILFEKQNICNLTTAAGLNLALSFTIYELFTGGGGGCCFLGRHPCYIFLGLRCSFGNHRQGSCSQALDMLVSQFRAHFASIFTRDRARLPSLPTQTLQRHRRHQSFVFSDFYCICFFELAPLTMEFYSMTPQLSSASTLTSGICSSHPCFQALFVDVTILLCERGTVDQL